MSKENYIWDKKTKRFVVCMSFTSRKDEVEMKDLVACLLEGRSSL